MRDHYSKPVPGSNRCEILYATGTPSNLVTTVLDTDGKHGSISTALIVDKATDTIHVSYIQHQTDPATRLVYQTIVDGIPSEQHIVAPGGWHTVMQLNPFGEIVFVRENGTSLNLLLPAGETTWSGITFAPSGSIQYRLAGFAMDREFGTYHVIYGDNAGTHNGAPLHNLHYATSQGATHWDHEIVDDSLTLWELEFWTSIVLGGDGRPIVSMYKYAEYGGAYNTGTAWSKQLIAGTIPGQTPPDHRAGMGGQLHIDDAGILYGAWDNSPDYPIDFDGPHGNIVMDHSVDGGPWQSKTQIEPFSAEGYCRMASHRTNLYMLVLGNYTDAKLYLIQLDSRRQWWRKSTDMSNGWRWSKGIGYVNVSLDPWIFHANHGWMFSTSLSPDNLWFWTADLGWLWTREGTYPYFWSRNRNAWLWYNGATTPRWFVDMQTGQWLSAP